MEWGSRTRTVAQWPTYSVSIRASKLNSSLVLPGPETSLPFASGQGLRACSRDQLLGEYRGRRGRWRRGRVPAAQDRGVVVARGPVACRHRPSEHPSCRWDRDTAAGIRLHGSRSCPHHGRAEDGLLHSRRGSGHPSDAKLGGRGLDTRIVPTESPVTRWLRPRGDVAGLSHIRRVSLTRRRGVLLCSWPV